MAISVYLRYHSARDAILLYNSIIKEMGRSGGVVAPGEIYHLAALAQEGMFVADLWESREAFDAYARSTLIPLTAKRGLFSPEVEFCDLHRTIDGESSSTGGSVAVVHLEGDTEELLRKYDLMEPRLASNIPTGLVVQWSAKRPAGMCITSHWRGREDCEAFITGPFSEALRLVGLPQPRLEFYDIYNSMDGRRVHA